MSKNDDYTTENLLNFSYHQNYYKLLGINFTGKLEEDDGAKCFLLLKSSKEKIINFYLDSLIATE